MLLQGWGNSELLAFLLVLAFAWLTMFRIEKEGGGGSWSPFLRQHKGKIVIALVLTAAFFPIVGLIAQFFDRLPLAAAAWELAPRRPFIREITERVQFEAEAQAKLRANSREVGIGALRFRIDKGKSPPSLLAEGDSASHLAPGYAWFNAAGRSVASLAQLLPGSPPLPVIELRALYDSHGHFDNPFALAIDSESDEPLRTVMHELTHLYLLWALIPGLPVDCPRWLNEGLAEHVSGKAMHDADGWGKYAMVRQSSLVDLDAVSPAFSWPGHEVEWHARDAVAMLLDRHGDKTLRRLINGLRLARPFHSVYPIVTGQPLDSFASAWKQQFIRQRVLENQTRAEVSSRLQWLAKNRGFVEMQILLNGLSTSFLADEEQKSLISQARIYEAQKCLDKGQLFEAPGWLRKVDPDLPGNEAVRGLIAKARQSYSAIDLEAGAARRPMPEKLHYDGFSRLIAWVLAAVVSALLVTGYTVLRPKLTARLKRCWLSHSSGTAFRWLVVSLTGLAGSWFLRFLVISMIPYGGLAALSDLHRIILAETLCIILWMALAWQIGRWNFEPADQQAAVSAADIRPRIGASADLAIFLAVGIISPLLAVFQAGWRPMGFEAAQTLFSAMLFLAGSAAFGLVVWEAAIQWNRGRGSTLGPALLYALFRGGLAADPYGSLFALVAGWRLVELARNTRQVPLAILGDILLCGPALLLCTGWFPACDPVGGYWYGSGNAVIWWLPAAIVLFLLRGAGREYCRPG